MTEVKEYIEDMGIHNPVLLSKWRWRKQVKIYINSKNRKNILENIKKYKKLNYDDFYREEFKRKDYFYEYNLETVRGLFRLSSRMLETVRGDFPNKYRRKSLRCPSCRFNQCSSTDIQTDQQTDIEEEGPIDTLEHIKSDCKGFIELRSQYDLSDDVQLLNFFHAVVNERKERGED